MGNEDVRLWGDGSGRWPMKGGGPVDVHFLDDCPVFRLYLLWYVEHLGAERGCEGLGDLLGLADAAAFDKDVVELPAPGHVG